MPTLVLPPRHTPDTAAMWRAALAAGWRVERIYGWRPPAALRDQDPVLYGEPLWASAVADALDRALVEPTLSWLADLPATYRRRDVRFVTLAEARSVPGPVFVKPADDKCFPAQVYASGAALASLPATEELPDALPVLIAEPVIWEVEFRCFVLDRQVAALSPYWRAGRLAQAEDESWPATPAEREQTLRLSAAALGDAGVAAPPAFVLDVGEIRGRGWAVVEANPAWGSGIYGCDPERVLPVLRRACASRAGLSEDDRRWIVERGGEERCAM